ncbi:choloylglycine hydrolase [Chlorella sorokiniana]|uniref:Choloylglycine hydrolase n=1 Tax=Chlorella sorokiniana TaxID=3076 RepID=A0A2P6TTN1_CHLSO|nr:choloylglycine hydrolase [Chlorella sorokiniana]|eukprot:PRW57425.1 choloylglycine hydrolase [Chlorella sorokiniana]
MGQLAASFPPGGSYDPQSDAVISWRHLDEPMTLFNGMAWVGKGTKLQLVPVLNSSYSEAGATYKAEYSFACMTASRDIISFALEDALPDVQLEGKSWPGVCSDGMNDRGLAISMQMQFDTKTVNNYGVCIAVEQMDSVTFLLANYESALDVKEDIDSGALQLVWNKALAAPSLLLLQSEWSPVHLVLYDRFNKSVVIEWAGEDGKTTAYDNTDIGALANNPMYPEQVKYIARMQEIRKQNQAQTFHDSDYYWMPGGYNSSDRMARASMLRLPGRTFPWPQSGDIDGPFVPDLSPGFKVPGFPDTNGALMGAIAASGAVFLPQGLDDAGGATNKGCTTKDCLRRDIVWWTALRDHKNCVMYWRVANSPIWRRTDLHNYPWRSDRVEFGDMEPHTWWVDAHPSPLLNHDKPNSLEEAALAVERAGVDYALKRQEKKGASAPKPNDRRAGVTILRGGVVLAEHDEYGCRLVEVAGLKLNRGVLFQHAPAEGGGCTTIDGWRVCSGGPTAAEVDALFRTRDPYSVPELDGLIMRTKLIDKYEPLLRYSAERNPLGRKVHLGSAYRISKIQSCQAALDERQTEVLNDLAQLGPIETATPEKLRMHHLRALARARSWVSAGAPIDAFGGEEVPGLGNALVDAICGEVLRVMAQLDPGDKLLVCLHQTPVGEASTNSTSQHVKGGRFMQSLTPELVAATGWKVLHLDWDVTYKHRIDGMRYSEAQCAALASVMDLILSNLASGGHPVKVMVSTLAAAKEYLNERVTLDDIYQRTARGSAVTAPPVSPALWAVLPASARSLFDAAFVSHTVHLWDGDKRYKGSEEQLACNIFAWGTGLATLCPSPCSPTSAAAARQQDILRFSTAVAQAVLQFKQHVLQGGSIPGLPPGDAATVAAALQPLCLAYQAGASDKFLKPQLTSAQKNRIADAKSKELDAVTLLLRRRKGDTSVSAEQIVDAFEAAAAAYDAVSGMEMIAERCRLAADAGGITLEDLESLLMEVAEYISQQPEAAAGPSSRAASAEGAATSSRGAGGSQGTVLAAIQAKLQTAHKMLDQLKRASRAGAAVSNPAAPRSTAAPSSGPRPALPQAATPEPSRTGGVCRPAEQPAASYGAVVDGAVKNRPGGPTARLEIGDKTFSGGLREVRDAALRDLTMLEVKAGLEPTRMAASQLTAAEVEMVEAAGSLRQLSHQLQRAAAVARGRGGWGTEQRCTCGVWH